MPPDEKKNPPAAARAIIFEYVAIGAVVKVTAIDELTGVEVSIMGPVRAARHDLQQLAKAKLLKRLARQSDPSQ